MNKKERDSDKFYYGDDNSPGELFKIIKNRHETIEAYANGTLDRCVSILSVIYCHKQYIESAMVRDDFTTDQEVQCGEFINKYEGLIVSVIKRYMYERFISSSSSSDIQKFNITEVQEAITYFQSFYPEEFLIAVEECGLQDCIKSINVAFEEFTKLANQMRITFQGCIEKIGIGSDSPEK